MPTFADPMVKDKVAPIPAIRGVAIWAARFDPLESCRRSRVERAPLSSYIATDRFRGRAEENWALASASFFSKE